MAIGYARGNYVYAFVVSEEKQRGGRIRDAEVRVYPSVDACTNDVMGTAIDRLSCDPSSILADSIRP